MHHDTAGAPPAHARDRIWRGVSFAVIVVAAFLLGLSSPWFHNDHFDSLSRARQVIVAGPQTVIDSLDWGRPLQIFLSAAFQYLFGNTLLGEAILTVGAIALTVGLVFLIAWQISGSALSGLFAALLTIWIEPRLYNYPKLLVPTVGVWLAWRFIDHPTTMRAIVMGTWTGVAFLLRHDLGIYVGVASMCAVFLRLGRGPFVKLVQGSLALGAAAGVVVAPYVGVVAACGGLGEEGQRGFANLLSAASLTWRPLELRAGWPFRIEPVTPPTITIRWREGLSDAERMAIEERLGLRERHDPDPPRTWSYRLERVSRDDLRQLVGDAAVDDTAGIDRSRLRVIEPWWQRFGRYTPIFRIRPAEWLGTTHNAEAWIYYLFIASLVIGVLIGPLSARLSPDSHPTVKVWTLVAFAAPPLLFLIRHNLDSRLADAAPLSFVTFAWLTHSALRRSKGIFRLGRIALRTAAVMAAVITWGSLSIIAGDEAVGRTINRMTAVPATLPESVSELRKRPIDVFAREQVGLGHLARWLWECTSPDDRILIVGYYPQLFYYSERAFAGGTPFFHQPYFTDPVFQDRIVDHLRRERIPLVVVETKDEPLDRAYSRVGDYVRQNFAAVMETNFGHGLRFQILVNRSVQPRESPKYPGLPCFRAW